MSALRQPLTLSRVGLCWASLLHASLPELIDAAGLAGFASLTVAPHLYFEARERGITDADLRERLTDAGMVITSIDPLIRGLPALPSADEVPAGLRKVFLYGEDECYRAAEALRASDINITHWLGRPVAPGVFSEALDGICERARRRGLGTTLEFMPDTAIPDLSAASALCTQLQGKGTRLLIDMWHVARSNASRHDIERLPGGSIRGIQLCDRRTPAPGQPYVALTGRELPGEGDLPLAALLESALANSPTARVELEIVNNSRLKGLAPRDAARQMADSFAQWAAAMDLHGASPSA